MWNQPKDYLNVWGGESSLSMHSHHSSQPPLPLPGRHSCQGALFPWDRCINIHTQQQHWKKKHNIHVTCVIPQSWHQSGASHVVCHNRSTSRLVLFTGRETETVLSDSQQMQLIPPKETLLWVTYRTHFFGVCPVRLCIIYCYPWIRPHPVASRHLEASSSVRHFSSGIFTCFVLFCLFVCLFFFPLVETQRRRRPSGEFASV